MTYTQSQLEEALTVFKVAKKRDRRQLQSLRPVPKYRLRRGPRMSPLLSPCHKDSDMSSQGEEDDNTITTRREKQKQMAKQKSDAAGCNHAFVTLVLASARGSRLLMELDKKDNTRTLKGSSTLSSEPEDLVERDLKVRQKVREQLEKHFNSTTVPDAKLPDNTSSQNQPVLPTPPPSIPLSDSGCGSPGSSIFVDSPIANGSAFGDPIVLGSPKQSNHSSDSEESLVELGFTANTNWAHPIDFKLCPKQSGLACDFCSNCIFGIEGLGPCRPTFVLGASKHEWKEVENGHREMGNPPTRMCVHCATQRIRISMCPRHAFERIPGMSIRSFPFGEYARALTDLMEGHVPVTPEFKYPMCRLCTRPAFYRCSWPQVRSITMTLLPPGQRLRGCGLQVCLHCLASIEKQNGKLTKCTMDQNAGEFFQYRADAEFLEPNSLLRMAYGAR